LGKNNLLASSINYARTFQDAEGSVHEEGDRWQQTLLYWQIASECWAEAERRCIGTKQRTSLVTAAQAREIPCAVTSGMACVHFGVAATTSTALAGQNGGTGFSSAWSDYSTTSLAGVAPIPYSRVLQLCGYRFEHHRFRRDAPPSRLSVGDHRFDSNQG